jgi:hypothetical protein
MTTVPHLPADLNVPPALAVLANSSQGATPARPVPIPPALQGLAITECRAELSRSRLWLYGLAVAAAGLLATALHGALLTGLGFAVLAAGVLGMLEARLNSIQQRRAELLVAMDEANRSLARLLWSSPPAPPLLSVLQTAEALRQASLQCAGTPTGWEARLPLHHVSLVPLWALHFLCPAIGLVVFALKTAIRSACSWQAHHQLGKAAASLAQISSSSSDPRDAELSPDLHTLLWLARQESGGLSSSLIQASLGTTPQHAQAVAEALENPRAASGRQVMRALRDHHSVASALLVQSHGELMLMASDSRDEERQGVRERLHRLLRQIAPVPVSTQERVLLGKQLILFMCRSAEAQPHRQVSATALMRWFCTPKGPLVGYLNDLLSSSEIPLLERFHDLLKMKSLIDKAKGGDPSLAAELRRQGAERRLSDCASTLATEAGFTRLELVRRLILQHLENGLDATSHFLMALPMQEREELLTWLAEPVQEQNLIAQWMRATALREPGAERHLIALCELPSGMNEELGHCFGQPVSCPALELALAELGSRGWKTFLNGEPISGFGEGAGAASSELYALLGAIWEDRRELFSQLLIETMDSLNHPDCTTVRMFPEEGLAHLRSLMREFGDHGPGVIFPRGDWSGVLAPLSRRIQETETPALMILRVQRILRAPANRDLLTSILSALEMTSIDDGTYPAIRERQAAVTWALSQAQEVWAVSRPPQQHLLWAEARKVEAQLTRVENSRSLAANPEWMERQPELRRRLDELRQLIEDMIRRREALNEWMPAADHSRREDLEHFLDVAEPIFEEQGLSSPWAVLSELNAAGRSSEVQALTYLISAWLQGAPLAFQVEAMLAAPSITRRLPVEISRLFSEDQASVRGALLLLECCGLVVPERRSATERRP